MVLVIVSAFVFVPFGFAKKVKSQVLTIDPSTPKPMPISADMARRCSSFLRAFSTSWSKYKVDARLVQNEVFDCNANDTM